MNAPHPLSFHGKRLAFRYAWQGISYMLRTEPNAWFQIGVWVVVTAAGLALGLTAGEWCAAVLAMALVWITEALNTAIEDVVDLASPERHPLAGRAKDIAAGSVVMSVAVSAIIGLIIFGPRLWALLP
ncbi:MAG: diacylglycerol kinase family protein [Vicinamibacteraceae bacterium]